MDNDVARHEVAEIMALVQDQMRDLSAMQKKRSQLAATAKAADGAIEVSVDAHGVVTGVVIDESYLDEFEMTDLGGHITAAARKAAQDVGRQAAGMLAPAMERRGAIRALSDVVVDVPELGDALSHLNFASPPDEAAVDPAGEQGWGGNSSYPSVRS